MINEFDSLYNSGTQMKEKNNLYEASLYFERAVELIKEIDGESHYSFLAHQGMALVMNDMGRFEEAKENALKSISIFSLKRNKLLPRRKKMLASSYSLLGEVQLWRGDLENAFSSINVSLSLHEKETMVTAIDFYHLAWIDYWKKDFEMAFKHIRKAMEIILANQSSKANLYIECCTFLASLHCSFHEFAPADKVWNELETNGDNSDKLWMSKYLFKRMLTHFAFSQVSLFERCYHQLLKSCPPETLQSARVQVSNLCLIAGDLRTYEKLFQEACTKLKSSQLVRASCVFFKVERVVCISKWNGECFISCISAQLSLPEESVIQGKTFERENVLRVSFSDHITKEEYGSHNRALTEEEFARKKLEWEIETNLPKSTLVANFELYYDKCLEKKVDGASLLIPFLNKNNTLVK